VERIPALLMRMSARPKRSRARASRRSAVSGAPISAARMADSVGRLACMSLRRSSRRAVSTSRAPASLRFLATAAPMPADEPVTTATFPDRFMMRSPMACEVLSDCTGRARLDSPRRAEVSGRGQPGRNSVEVAVAEAAKAVVGGTAAAVFPGVGYLAVAHGEQEVIDVLVKLAAFHLAVGFRLDGDLVPFADHALDPDLDGLVHHGGHVLGCRRERFPAPGEVELLGGLE